MKKTVFIIVAVLLAIAFCVSAFMVVSYVKESKEQEKMRNELAAAMAQAATQPATEATEATTTEPTAEETEETTAPTEATEPPMLAEMVPVFEENPDTVGFINIPGTKLENPVLQTPDDPNYYLKHDFYGKYSDWGAIYAWSTADLKEPSDHITLFGHNMKDGSMFACLHKYTDKAFWEENPLIIFNTLNEYHVYKIYAVYKTAAVEGGFAYHQFVDAANAQEFNEFVATCKEKAFYDTGLTPVYGDKLISLSTCEYTLGDVGRLVVSAVRIS